MSAEHPSRQRLEAYRYDRLSAADCAAVEGHLNECPECEHRFERLCGELESRYSAIVDIPQDASEAVQDAKKGHKGPALFVGKVVGGYTLESLLGKGGMGEVWKATKQGAFGMPHYYAIKFPRNDLMGAFLRFPSELEILNARLHGKPGVVLVIGSGRDPESALLYYVMDFQDGQTLRKRINEGCFNDDPVKAAKTVAELANIVDEVHRANVFHRDIKPENVMVTDDNRLLLIDFGLAEVRDRLNEVRAGSTDAICVDPIRVRVSGTAGYTPPDYEAFRSSFVTCDIYALGKVLFDLLTGPAEAQVDSVCRRLSDGSTEPAQTRAAPAAEAPSEPATPGDSFPWDAEMNERAVQLLHARVPWKLARICMKAFGREAGRYKHSRDLSADLCEFVKSLESIEKSATEHGDKPADIGINPEFTAAGWSTWNNPHACAEQLRDIANENYREAFLLVEAVRSGVVRQFDELLCFAPVESLTDNLWSKAKGRGVTRGEAHWAVSKWMRILKREPLPSLHPIWWTALPIGLAGVLGVLLGLVFVHGWARVAAQSPADWFLADEVSFSRTRGASAWYMVFAALAGLSGMLYRGATPIAGHLGITVAAAFTAGCIGCLVASEITADLVLNALVVFTAVTLAVCRRTGYGLYYWLGGLPLLAMMIGVTPMLLAVCFVDFPRIMIHTGLLLTMIPLTVLACSTTLAGFRTTVSERRWSIGPFLLNSDPRMLVCPGNAITIGGLWVGRMVILGAVGIWWGWHYYDQLQRVELNIPGFTKRPLTALGAAPSGDFLVVGLRDGAVGAVQELDFKQGREKVQLQIGDLTMIFNPAPPGAVQRDLKVKGVLDSVPKSVTVDSEEKICLVICERDFGLALGFWMINHPDRITAVTFRDERHLITGDEAGFVRLYDVKSGVIWKSAKAHAGELTTVAASRDGKSVVSGDKDGLVRLWRGADGGLVTEFAYGGEVNAVAVSRDGKRLAAGGADGQVRVWAVDNGRVLGRFHGHWGQVNGVVFSTDGQEVISAGEDGVLRFWRVR